MSLKSLNTKALDLAAPFEARINILFLHANVNFYVEKDHKGG